MVPSPQNFPHAFSVSTLIFCKGFLENFASYSNFPKKMLGFQFILQHRLVLGIKRVSNCHVLSEFFSWTLDHNNTWIDIRRTDNLIMTFQKMILNPSMQ